MKHLILPYYSEKTEEAAEVEGDKPKFAFFKGANDFQEAYLKKMEEDRERVLKAVERRNQAKLEEKKEG